MADLATYAGQQPNWQRVGPIYPVEIVTAESGHEVRTVWATVPRYQYEAEIILQGVATEVAAVVTLVNGAHEKGHTFTIVDPVTGLDVAVRLESTLSVTPYQGIAGWYTAKFSAITVVA